jgi:FMN phosphatase YigB (HAD superfamily)
MRVVFDIVNTLLFHKPSIPELYCEILKQYKYSVTAYDIIQARKKTLIKKASYQAKCECGNAESTYREKWIASTASILKECRISSHQCNEIAEAIHFTLNSESAKVIAASNTFEIMEWLRRGQNLVGALSNSYSFVRSWLGYLGIDIYFDFLLISSEICHLKPCPIAFQRALKEGRNVDDEISVFVGDDTFKDGIAAIYGGFDTAVIINSSHLVDHRNIIYASKLSELPTILESLQNSDRLSEG